MQEQILLKERRLLVDAATDRRSIKLRGGKLYVDFSFPFNIIALADTWQSEKIYNSEILPTGYYSCIALTEVQEVEVL